MSTLPELWDWETTGRSLHQAAQLLGAIRMLLLEPAPNHLELALEIRPQGVSTGRLPFAGEVILDFRKAALVYRSEKDTLAIISLEGRSQRSLFETLLSALAADGHVLAPKTSEHPTYSAAFKAALAARGRGPSHTAQFSNETPFEINQSLAADYAQALYRIFTATARFRARLAGPMTPVVIWPGHFDLSFLWFATPEANEGSPHMNFGFAPYSEGIERPYLYSYVWPLPQDFVPANLPDIATWNTERWTGAVVPYDELVKSDDPEAVVESSFQAIYEALLPAIRET